MNPVPEATDWSTIIPLIISVASFVSGTVLGGLGVYFSQKARPEPLRGILFSKQVEMCISLQRAQAQLTIAVLKYLGRMSKEYIRVGSPNWIPPTPDEHKQHLNTFSNSIDSFVAELHAYSGVIPRDVVQAANRYRDQLEKSLIYLAQHMDPYMKSGGKVPISAFDDAESHMLLIANVYKQTVQEIRKSLGIDPLSSSTIDMLAKV